MASFGTLIVKPIREKLAYTTLGKEILVGFETIGIIVVDRDDTNWGLSKGEFSS